MSKIIEFDEETYRRLCDENLTDFEKWHETVFITKDCGSVENNPKLRVILELIYHALQFSLASGLQYYPVSVLIETIQNELICIMESNADVINEIGCKQRYIEIVQRRHAENAMTLDDMKLISKFYSANFIRQLESYQYVLQELHSEDQEIRLIEVQTPMIPLPLRNCVPEQV